MELYSVMTNQVAKYLLEHPSLKKQPFNFLVQARKTTYPYLDDYKNCKILVDSGAYYFNYRMKTQDSEKTKKFIDNFLEFVENTCDDPRISGYFDMDLVYLGLNGIKSIRKRLFNITDKIIPVYHTIWGLNEYKRMCRNYDYLALGCSNNAEFNDDQYMPFIKFAHKFHCKVHGLGMDRNRVMKKVPFNSCDSAIWVRDGYMNYYANHNIKKTPENNKKYQAIYVRRSLMNQLNRQRFYKEYWSSYGDFGYGKL